MKKTIITLLILGCSHPLFASYVFRNSASNLNSGVVPDAAINYSSITAQGSLIGDFDPNTTRGGFYISTRPVPPSNYWFMVGDSSFVILNNGYMGFGTNRPETKFHLVGGSMTLESNSSLEMRAGGISIGAGPKGSSLFDVNNGSVTIRGNLVGLAMAPTGGLGTRLGVGTQGPSSAIDVDGGSLTIRGTNAGLRVTSLAGNSTLGTDAAGNFIAGSGGGGSVQNSTEVLRFGYSGSLNISTQTICGWLTACFNTMESTYNVMGIMASVVEPSTVAATIFNLIVATNSAISPLMASTTYFPTVVITTQSSAGQQQFRVSTGAAGVAPGGVPPPIVILPWSTIGIQMSTMAVSGTLPRGLKIGINAWTVR